MNNNEILEHKILKSGFISLLVIIISFIILLFVGVLGPQMPIISLVTVPAAILGLGAHIGLFIAILLVLIVLIVLGPNVAKLVQIVISSIKNLFNQKLHLKELDMPTLTGGSILRFINLSPLIILLLLIFMSLILSVIVQILTKKTEDKKENSIFVT